MGQQKLNNQEKKEKIIEKQRKEQDRKNVMLQLIERNKSTTAQSLNKLASIQDINKSEKIEKKQIRNQKQKKPEAKIQVAQDSDSSDSYGQQPIQQLKPQDQKQSEIKETDLNQGELQIEGNETQQTSGIKNMVQTSVNIFQTSFFVNEKKAQDFIEKKILKPEQSETLKQSHPAQKQQTGQHQRFKNERMQLELAVQQACADFSFDTYDSRKNQTDLFQKNIEIKQSIQQLDKETPEQALERRNQFFQEEDLHPFYEDDLLKPIMNEIQQQSVKIERTSEITESREKLPIFMREHEIMESINNNLVTIICGQTGSGKSTQLPQFLIENGYGSPDAYDKGMIGITQPRRIAAISLAKRVADQMNCQLGKDVIYQVRHESSNFEENSQIKFMTDGILLNQMSSDFLLSQYSVIVIDEAHERQINTDLLLGLLSRLVNIRARLALQSLEIYKQSRAPKKNLLNSSIKSQIQVEKEKSDDALDYSKLAFPLRLVIMSATLRVEDFTNNKYLLPKNVNVINVEARQFGVNVYFNKRTPENFIDEAVKQTIKIHSTLPPGDILVFLTGERDIKEFIITIESKLSARREEYQKQLLRQNMRKNSQDSIGDGDEDGNLADNDYDLNEDEESEDYGFENKLGQQRKNSKDFKEKQVYSIIKHQPTESEGVVSQKRKKQFMDYVLLPLYSKLAIDQQEQIFQGQRSDNVRMIIAATNVAETSITIPNIKFIIDCGREKQKVYNNKLSISRHVITWISQASAEQRSGRAGRTGPGYCYRLYAPSVYANIFNQFSEPEIVSVPLENVILNLKSVGIQSVIDFPYPTRPDNQNFLLALKNLISLKAVKNPIQEKQERFMDFDIEDVDQYQAPQHNNEQENQDSLWKDETQLTDLGRVLALIPLNPKFSKMLLFGRSLGVLGYTLLIVASLSVQEIFDQNALKRLSIEQEEKENEKARAEGKKVHSTHKQQQQNSYNDDDIDQEQDDVQQQLQEFEQEEQRQQQARERYKRELQVFKERFNQFFIGKSDLFIKMNILGFFFQFVSEQSVFATSNKQRVDMDQLIETFSEKFCLLSKSLREIYFNVNQLLEIMESIIDRESEKDELSMFLHNYVFPDETQKQALTEIIISTFISQVARKVALHNNDDQKRNIKVYESTETSEQCVIHNTSYFTTKMPEYVIYTEIFETKQKFLLNITQVDDIALLRQYDLDKQKNQLWTLEEPKPFYSQSKNQLVQFAQCQFSQQKWQLQPFQYLFEEDSVEKYCCFAKCLLQGSIIPQFKALEKLFRVQTSIINQSNINPVVQKIVNKLQNNQIDHKQRLVGELRQDIKFLLDEVLMWVQVQFHEKIKKNWPLIKIDETLK